MEMPPSARNFLRKFPEKLPLGDLPFSKKNKAHLFLFCILRCCTVYNTQTVSTSKSNFLDQTRTYISEKNM